VLEFNLTDAERAALQVSAESVRQNIQRASAMLGSC
jgi:malate/lactate dehydrogenase